MSAADKLAQVLAEHALHLIEPVDSGCLSGPWKVICNCDAGHIQGGTFAAAEQAHAAHQAAVVLAHLTAEGWAQGREEWGVRRKLSPTRTVAWAMPSEAAAREETEGGMRPDLMEVVRRRVTDWEPVEGDQP